VNIVTSSIIELTDVMPYMVILLNLLPCNHLTWVSLHLKDNLISSRNFSN